MSSKSEQDERFFRCSVGDSRLGYSGSAGEEIGRSHNNLSTVYCCYHSALFRISDTLHDWFMCNNCAINRLTTSYEIVTKPFVAFKNMLPIRLEIRHSFKQQFNYRSFNSCKSIYLIMFPTGVSRSLFVEFIIG